MKALVHTKPFLMEYKNVKKPRLLKNCILVKVESVGICGSDIYGYTGTSGRRIPPLIMGHEASGIVAEANTNSKFKQGDKITFDSTIFVAHVIIVKAV